MLFNQMFEDKLSWIKVLFIFNRKEGGVYRITKTTKIHRKLVIKSKNPFVLWWVDKGIRFELVCLDILFNEVVVDSDSVKIESIVALCVKIDSLIILFFLEVFNGKLFKGWIKWGVPLNSKCLSIALKNGEIAELLLSLLFCQLDGLLLFINHCLRMIFLHYQFH